MRSLYRRVGNTAGTRVAVPQRCGAIISSVPANPALLKGNLDWLNITDQIKIEVHYDKNVMNYFVDVLTRFGFNAFLDTHHWSTVIGFKNEG